MPLPMQAGRAKAERRIPAENRAQTSSFPGLSRHSGVCRALPGAVTFLRPCSCGGHAGAMASQTHIWTGELERALLPAAAVCRARQQCACVMRVHASVHEPGAAPRASALQPASRRPPRTQTRRRRERSSRLLRTSGRRLDAAPIQKLTSCVSSGCPSPPPRRGTERARTGPDGSVWSVHCLHRLHWFRAAAPSFLCSSGKRHRQTAPGHEPRAASRFMPGTGLFPNPAAAPEKKAAGRSTQKTRTRT